MSLIIGSNGCEMDCDGKRIFTRLHANMLRHVHLCFVVEVCGPASKAKAKEAAKAVPPQALTVLRSLKRAGFGHCLSAEAEAAKPKAQAKKARFGCSWVSDVF